MFQKLVALFIAVYVAGVVVSAPLPDALSSGTRFDSLGHQQHRPRAVLSKFAVTTPEDSDDETFVGLIGRPGWPKGPLTVNKQGQRKLEQVWRKVQKSAMHLLKLQKAYKEAEEGPAKEEALKVLNQAFKDAETQLNNMKAQSLI